MDVPTVEEVFDDIRSYMDFLSEAGLSGTDCSRESLALVKSWGRGLPSHAPTSVRGARDLAKRPLSTVRDTTAGVKQRQKPLSVHSPRAVAESIPSNTGGRKTSTERSREEIRTSSASPRVARGSTGADSQNSKPSVHTLETLGAEMARCEKCPMRQDSPGVAAGWGSSDARVVFVTGVPDPEALAVGNPFAGESGDLLDRMVKAMHLPMESVFYTSIVRCFPGGNTNLLKQAYAACMPYFWKQMGLIKPEVIVSFGTFASCAVTGRKSAVSAFRGELVDVGSVRVMPTYHPSELIRNASLKRPVWDDLKQVMGLLGLPV